MLEGQGSGVDLGDEEEVTYDSEETLGVPVDDAQERFLVLRQRATLAVEDEPGTRRRRLQLTKIRVPLAIVAARVVCFVA